MENIPIDWRLERVKDWYRQADEAGKANIHRFVMLVGRMQNDELLMKTLAGLALRRQTFEQILAVLDRRAVVRKRNQKSFLLR